MRILFIASRECDYLQDLTYAGLCEVLGRDSIIDFPFHWQYHSDKRYFWSRKLEYPKNLGFIEDPQRVSEGIGQIRKGLSENTFDLVILSSAKPDNLHQFCLLMDQIRVPWIFIDGGDWQEIGGDFRRLGGEKSFDLFQEVRRKKPPSIIFKRELPVGRKEDALFPLQFSVHSSIVTVKPADSMKRFQVQFWAVESSETRKEAFSLLKGRYDCDRNGTIAGQKFRKYNFKGEDYLNAVNQCRISLSFRGEGFDTLRYWEIPACGSLLLSEDPAIQIPNNFLDRKHAVFCKNDLSNLLLLIDYYLKNEKEAQEIAREGQKHLLKHHTHIHRAEYLLEILESKGVIAL